VLTVDASDLDVEFVGDGVESVFVLGEEWKLNMDRCSECSSKVGWARSDVTKMVIMGETESSFFFDKAGSL